MSAHYENRGDLSQADLDPSQQSKLGAGTDVMGQPVNPLHSSPEASISDASRDTHPRSSEDSPIYEMHTASGNFPTAQPPKSLSETTHQHQASQPASADASPSSPPQAASADSYVHTSPASGLPGKTPMENIMQVFNKWSKKAEDITGNVWGHLRTGPNIADTAMGRIAMGAKAMSEGGLENVYRQTFEVAPEEHLQKTYACYLSTSTGPVAGTLYISSHKLAFCSDRPLSIPASQPEAEPQNNTSPPRTATTNSSTSSTPSTTQQIYYKVMVPISQVEAVNPSENTQKKPPEKYVQVKTVDGHEFWFMGFVHYDKGVRNLQESLLSKATSPNTNSDTHVVN